MNERQLDRFSQIYLFGGKASEDGERFRVRLAALFDDCAPYRSGAPEMIQKVFERDCGVRVRSYGLYSTMTTVFEKGKMRDVLDAISITYRVLGPQYSRASSAKWKTGIPRLLAEENLAYRIDENCVVQRLVDEEFYRATASTIQALDSLELAGANAALKQGLAYLTGLDQNTKGAVTSTFEACEIIAKHLVPEAQNLNSRLCNTKLLELCISPTAGATEKIVESGVFAAMGEWVNAVHNYRHGQAEAEPIAPSMELAVQLVSMGCSFIRRLANILPNQVYQARGQLA